MFRRRRILQTFRPVRSIVEQELIRANSLFERGEYHLAAPIYERMAGLAAARGGLRAPRYYFQAGRAYVRVGQLNHGMDLMREGRRLALSTGNHQVIAAAVPRLRAELEELGFNPQAREIAAWSAGMAAPAVETAVIEKSSIQLPLKCPACGASVLSDEVEWVDDRTAECAFCGSPLRAE
jgi:hypothetical protein